MKILQILALVFCLNGIVFSQDFARGETLKGIVKDQSGAEISNVKIIAKKSDGLVLTAAASENGRYEITLPFGHYDIEFIPPKCFDNRVLSSYRIKAKSYTGRKLNVILKKNSDYRKVLEFYCEPKANSKNDFDCVYVAKFEKTDKLILSEYVLTQIIRLLDIFLNKRVTLAKCGIKSPTYLVCRRSLITKLLNIR